MITQQELCPSCGDFVFRLLDSTGWCSSCSRGSDQKECRLCHRVLALGTHLTCASCRKSLWLEKNADAIEDYREAGYSLKEAIRLVRLGNKTRCLSCHEPLTGGGSKGHPPLFCNASKCRRIYSRYKDRRQKGLTQEQAIREALQHEHRGNKLGVGNGLRRRVA